LRLPRFTEGLDRARAAISTAMTGVAGACLWGANVLMSVAGLILPQFSAFDPPAAGEGSLDPMGLAAISDRLANVLVPGLRARMQRVRFVTATAVGALACETLADEFPADGVSTAAICFEWLVVEGFVRRLSPQQIPFGVPGSQKARVVVASGQRLSAATYLKGPAVFGFNGVYKPFAIDAGVVGPGFEPGLRCPDLVRAWESEQGFGGFADTVPRSDGARLRANIRDEIRAALRHGQCTTNPSGWLFGRLAAALHPDDAGPRERTTLRALVTDPSHETRAELAELVADLDIAGRTEAQTLNDIRPRCSATLGRIVDAVVAYERFAALLDAAFRTLCTVSYAMGTQPLTPKQVHKHEIIERCARELPDRFRVAADCMHAIGVDDGMEIRLNKFAIPWSPAELVEELMAHHEAVQAGKPPNGKRSWFDPLKEGWVVRAPYGSTTQPELGSRFVHPVRVDPLRRFLEDTAL
jgi:hypothetical protein